MRSFAILTLRKEGKLLAYTFDRKQPRSALLGYNRRDPPLRREHYFLLLGRMGHPGERLYRWTFQFLGSIANYEIARSRLGPAIVYIADNCTRNCLHVWAAGNRGRKVTHVLFFPRSRVMRVRWGMITRVIAATKRKFRRGIDVFGLFTSIQWTRPVSTGSAFLFFVQFDSPHRNSDK